jgi:hypothetical protein
MADDRNKKDDLGGMRGGQQGGQPGQQSPGRHNPDDEKFGKPGGGQATPGRGLEDDDQLDQGGAGRGGNIGNKPGGGQGGQNR